jgi:hypothetical protein
MASDSDPRIKYKVDEFAESLISEYDIFQQREFFVFTACVGYANGRLDKDHDGEKEMLWMNLASVELYKALAGSIAYQHHEEPEMLLDRQSQLETLSWYSAGGAEVLKEKFGDIKGDPTDALVSYIKEYRDESESEGGQTKLRDIMQSFEADSQSDAEVS